MNPAPATAGGHVRILNVIHSLDPALGGPAEGLRQMCQATRRMGHLQEVLTLDRPEAPWLGEFPAPVHAVGPRLTHYGFTPELRPWLHASVRNYDAVIVHGLWQYQGLAAWHSLRGSGVPYYVYPHGMLDPWFRRHYPLKHLKKQLYWRLVESRVLADARAVFFTTEEEARQAEGTFSPYRVQALNMGYGLALDPVAQAATAEDFLGAHPALRGRRLLLFLGRLHVKKGLDLLIDAFAAESAAAPDLHLVVAGPDEQGLRAALEPRAAALGIAGRITWAGMLKGRMKWGAFRAAEAFALPSHQENFGIAVAEALAAGVPVLISDKVNICHEVAQDGAGFVAADDAAGTRETLRRWLALDAAGRARMAVAARGCYERRFHIDAAARTLVQTLEPRRRVHSSP